MRKRVGTAAAAATMLLALSACDDLGTPGVSYTAEGAYTILGPGDVNGDGHVDLMFKVDGSSVGVLVGDGHGGFTSTSVSHGGGITGSEFASLGDANGDGLDDVLVSVPEPSATWPSGRQWRHSLLLNLGAGGFGGATTIHLDDTCGTCVGGSLVRLIDVNGDDAVDAVGRQGDGTLVSRLGNGTGGFGNPIISTTPPMLGAGFVPADLNGDGHVDLAFGAAGSNLWGGLLGVFWGDGTGAFPTSSVFDWTAGNVFGGVAEVEVGDFDGDGDSDVVGLHHHNEGDVPRASLLLSDGAGGFAAPVARSVPAALAGADVADFDGDGFDDLVATGSYQGTDGKWASKGAVLFGGPGVTQFQDSRPLGAGRMVSRDFDEDGKPDVAVRGNSVGVTVFLNRWEGRPSS